MQKLIESLAKWNNAAISEWACRVLISLGIILPLLPVIESGYEGYQLIMGLLLLIGCWCYFSKLKLLAILVLLFGILVHILRQTAL